MREKEQLIWFFFERKEFLSLGIIFSFSYEPPDYKNVFLYPRKQSVDFWTKGLVSKGMFFIVLMFSAMSICHEVCFNWNNLNVTRVFLGVYVGDLH